MKECCLEGSSFAVCDQPKQLEDLALFVLHVSEFQLFQR